MPDPRARIAFVKFGGLSAGGTERWLQMMAAHLPRDRFEVTYFFCDTAPYVGSDFRHPGTDRSRVAFMEEAGVALVEFHVGAKDVTTPVHEWVDTDFWDVFDPHGFDLVQTAKAGPPEYPYDRMPIPVVEYVTLSAGVDRGPAIARSLHLSQWQRRQWAAGGGDLGRTDVIRIPAEAPATADDLREELGIPAGAVVAGMHQRVQDEIFSPIPLAAFARLTAPDRWFVLMGGSGRYREQARELGLERVVFLDHDGGAERISRFLNTLDVFAHGRSDGETFGTVLAEAMAHGRPCVSHRSAIANAQPETMGPAGLFAHDEDDYADKLGRLLGDEGLRARLGAKARPHAERWYSLEACVERLVETYEGVLAGAPAAPRRLAYGHSELGFLMAGVLEDERDAAHHVIAGAPPDEPVADLLAEVLTGRSVEEIGSANSVLGFTAAANGAAVRIDAPDPAHAPATIDLNNWEDRVALGPATLDADVVVVNRPERVPDVLSRLRQRRPALLLRRASLPASLGYEVVPIGRAGWIAALHREEHADVLAAIPGWERDRRARILRRRGEAVAQQARGRYSRARIALGARLGR